MKYIAVFLFISVYIALGYILKLDANTYLLLGIPLMLIFQLGVRRQPFYKMWLRDGEDFHLSLSAWFIALIFTIFPVYKMVMMLLQHQFDWVIMAYYVAAIGGAVGAGYCFSNFNKKTFREFWLCFLITGGVGSLLMAGAIFIQAHFKHQPVHVDALKGLRSLLLYIPVGFMLEEVVFRGMLDSHIFQPGQNRKILSAVYISALWGFWHLPISPGSPIWVEAIVLALFHMIPGVPLSIFWRRSGNLAVVVFSHVFIDAVRNSLV